MLSNLQEVKARGGRVIAVGQAGDEALAAILEQGRDVLLEIPECPELLAPFLTRDPAPAARLPRALRAGHDVDQPRNLAKSVTVE